MDHIGLRSTRIRTLDRTVVSIPNGQIANATLETVSARDKFWFHPERAPALRHDAGAVARRPRRMPAAAGRASARCDRDEQRVRFYRLGPYSFDIEIFAYVLARDWNEFLQIQEQLLFGVTEIVERAGTALALPSQTIVRRESASGGRAVTRARRERGRHERRARRAGSADDGRAGSKLPPSARCRFTRCTRCSAWTRISAASVARARAGAG